MNDQTDSLSVPSSGLERLRVGVDMCLFALKLVSGEHAIIASRFRDLSKINGISKVWFLGHADSHVPQCTLCMCELSPILLDNAITQPNFTE